MPCNSYSEKLSRDSLLLKLFGEIPIFPASSFIVMLHSKRIVFIFKVIAIIYFFLFYGIEKHL